jgi:hypothetical protein
MVRDLIQAVRMSSKNALRVDGTGTGGGSDAGIFPDSSCWAMVPASTIESWAIRMGMSLAVTAHALKATQTTMYMFWFGKFPKARLAVSEARAEASSFATVVWSGRRCRFK